MNKEEFLKSKDFMKLGQTIEHGNWQVATMTAKRLQDNAKEAEIKDFDRSLIMIKQCIAGRKKTEAQNALAAVVAKRVAMLNKLSESESGDGV